MFVSRVLDQRDCGPMGIPELCRDIEETVNKSGNFCQAFFRFLTFHTYSVTVSPFTRKVSHWFQNQ